MKSEERRRFAALQQAWCGEWLIRELYGLKYADDNRLSGYFKTWASRFRRGRMVERLVNGQLQVDRYELENFFQMNRVVPRKWAAVDLGMSEKSLDELIEALMGDHAPISNSSNISLQLVDNEETSHLYKHFPDLRYKVFSSHSSMCKALHESMRSQYQIDVEVLHCVTSGQLTPDDPDLASAFDAITLDPVGLRHEVWLDFHKPVNLRPDCCSTMFYVQNEAELKPFVMRGSEPNIPPALRATGS